MFYSPEGFLSVCIADMLKNITFSIKGEQHFLCEGLTKGAEKMRIHDNSGSHVEAKIEWCSLNYPSIKEQLKSQVAKIQSILRAGLS